MWTSSGELVDERAFALGEKYFHDGRASIFSLETKRVLAIVTGTEDRRYLLTGRGSKIDGECSCRAFLDFARRPMPAQSRTVRIRLGPY
jgi:uncharacterized Zn finger protein